MASSRIRIVFMGTPEFAVASLSALVSGGYDVCAVVTAPDRPAGRGRKIRMSPVKAFALENGIMVLQPANLKDDAFIEKLRGLDATLFIVVAFRMLPEAVWNMPPLGTFNLHASLLPQYRGAAPINHTIINGERKGGVTTFFLSHEIDTGNIIFREETDIAADETAGQYHDRLMKVGAGLLMKTVKAIEEGKVETCRQEAFISEGEVLKTAPKIHKEDCRINWHQDAVQVNNLIRGLSPHPGAFTELEFPGGKRLYLKIYKSIVKDCSCEAFPGTVISDYKTFLDVCCGAGCISIQELQQAGKKHMSVHEFLLGLNFSSLD
jgi:methionyl-tRNA formyltransferase